MTYFNVIQNAKSALYFQRRDDDVPIILRKSLPEIGAIFEAQMEVAQEGLADQ